MDETIKAAIAVVGESLDAAGCTPDPVIGGGNEGRVRVEVRILRGEPWRTVSVYGRLSPPWGALRTWTLREATAYAARRTALGYVAEVCS